MKQVLQLLFEHKTLSRQQAAEVLLNLSKGLYNEHEITAFMTVYLMRTIRIEELLGFKDALLELAVPFNPNMPTIDIVGTGGDGKNTFNISTLSCFIVAGAGCKVTKHGNYGASSISGASNLMEQLGYKFTHHQQQLERQLATANICFLHAPLFHPALKIVAPIRKNLGMRTFFNILGPLVNPANPAYQLIGVFNLEMARIYSYLLQQAGKKFTVIHGLDGYDEITLTADAKVITATTEQILTPLQLGKRYVMPTDISAGTNLDEAVNIFKKIISGQGSFAQNAVVLANAALALYGYGVYASYQDAYEAAVESLESGKAANCLQTLLNTQI
jgi:anthranilate phosphoribosyltransferase